jgi:signal transduction histidine kinase
MTALVIIRGLLLPVYGQQIEADSTKIDRLLNKADDYFFTKPDSSIIYTREAILLSRKAKLPKREIEALNSTGEALRMMGDFPHALEMQYQALKLSRECNNSLFEAGSLGMIGLIFTEFNEYRLALDNLLLSNKITDSILANSNLTQAYNQPDIPIVLITSSFNISNTGNAYEGMNMLDSALYYQNLALQKAANLAHGHLKALILTRMGIVTSRLGRQSEALKYCQDALNAAYLSNDKVNPPIIFFTMATAYFDLKKFDSSLVYAHKALDNSVFSSQKLYQLASSSLLAKLFQHFEMPDSTIRYLEISMALKDSIFGQAKFQQLQLLTLREQQYQQELLTSQEKFKNRTKFIGLLSLLGFLLIVAGILLRNNKNKQKANQLLLSQKQEIQETLNKLTITQKQLLQSEKMASLGELTAGVAHEIQNPLNFVNNFSDLNGELLDDIKNATRNQDFREIEKLADQLIENEKKINYHGKRADAIVKNMLQHSRSGTGRKEPTEINKLTDEYVRLSFHGMRARDKSFNAALDLHYDPRITKINIEPQEIGRVLLNILNNAFYSVNEKQKSGIPDYEPTISVTTALKANSVLITIKDNGMGIPPHIRDKIFQPFFTTKPTGEGTGLGLSLSYDIVTKGHSGTLKLESELEEFTIFSIELPC